MARWMEGDRLRIRNRINLEIIDHRNLDYLEKF